MNVLVFCDWPEPVCAREHNRTPNRLPTHRADAFIHPQRHSLYTSKHGVCTPASGLNKRSIYGYLLGIEYKKTGWYLCYHQIVTSNRFHARQQLRHVDGSKKRLLKQYLALRDAVWWCEGGRFLWDVTERRNKSNNEVHEQEKERRENEREQEQTLFSHH